MRMKRRLMAWLIASLVLLSLAYPAGAARPKTPPAPVAVSAESAGDVSILGSSSPCGTPGTWYVGATPPNVDYTKPVLLFVHGKGGCAQNWWSSTTYHGTNDMYTYAYNNGYRTAFVDLYPDQDMWDNGAMLNTLIDLIRSHFGVSKVNIVAHSKGGVDSNSAAVHYGSAGKIGRIVTLGSPHWGTPLADHAYSTWTWWLAEIMGERNEATYVMQTGYMNYFRSVTDGRISSPPYYTLSGYKCGPVFSAMWYSCAFISGEDDGVVPVWSARIPGGTHLKEGYWDHDEIRMGSRTWSYFAPYIKTASAGALAVEGAKIAAAGPAADVTPGAARTSAPGNLILRGDRVAGSASTTFPVESGVRGASFTLFTSTSDMTATLTSPDGQAYPVTMGAQVPAEQPLSGLWSGGVEVSAPGAGQWQLTVNGDGGYLFVANLDSDLTASLDTGKGIAVPGARRDLAVTMTGRELGIARAAGSAGLGKGRSPVDFAGQAGRFQASLGVGGENGIYNVSVSVTGTLADGTAFERSLVSSFPAVHPQEIGTWR